MPPDTDLFRPGSCAMRLTNIDTLPSRSKTSLINSIATDISATFIYIAKQAEAGNLSTIHTGPINDIIGTIKDTEVAHREALERKLARYKKTERRLRRERKWMRRELMGLTKKTEEVVEDLKLKVHGASKELKFVREKYALLKTAEQHRSRSQEKGPSLSGEEEHV
ncbi:conserved hypothetical protein [Paecilomyces variotii No. 5]|uniref:Uncharacterized protein n=1 Tax=Byssochlamys spectabilis (strain No. 5 / NBRC 109023) TaxID=1356009 RepID=V5GEH1_BYSSN|nr:conserved hypothetical protein [Paecilomyces variotii No. 5]